MSEIEALEFLRPLDQLFMDQKTGAPSVLLGASAKHEYRLLDGHGDQVGTAIENDSGLMGRMLLRSWRGLTLRVYDKNSKEAIKMIRPLSLMIDEVSVYSGDRIIGTIKQTVFSLTPKFSIIDASNTEILVITGPLMVRFMPSATFTIKSPHDNRPLGTIKKCWSNLSREFFSTSDIFGLTFPEELEVNAKALLMGAALLIDFHYYEGR